MFQLLFRRNQLFLDKPILFAILPFIVIKNKRSDIIYKNPKALGMVDRCFMSLGPKIITRVLVND